VLLALPGTDAAPPAGAGVLLAMASRSVLAALALVLVVAGTVLLWPSGTAAPVPPPGALPPGPVAADAPQAAQPEERRAAVAPAPVEHVLAGRVTQPDGSAIQGVALLCVNPDGPAPAGVRPMSMAAASALKRADGASAVQFTQQGGQFRVDLGTHTRAWLEVLWAGAAIPPAGAWHDAPRQDLELRLLPAPTATVQVRVVQGGQPVVGFTVEAVRADGLVWPGAPGAQSPGEVLETQLPLTTDRDGDEYEVRASKQPAGRAATRVRLQAGQVQQVVLELPGAAVVQGAVVDGNGAPIADALVCFGTFERLRGDEPFKPFKPARVRDGVRTDAAGGFSLSGPGERLVLFHPDWTPVVVARADAARVALPARGTIVGRLVDPAGQPRAGVSIALDRERPVVTDAHGAFLFDGVFAGVRGLCLPDKQYVGVTVRPGATAEVEIGRDLAGVTVRLRGLERAVLHQEGLLLVGIGDVCAAYAGKVESDVLALPSARPGRYWLLSRGAPIALLDLQVPAAEVQVGSATLTVRGAAGRRVVVVPAGASELVRCLAARPSPVTLGAEGTARFQALPAGDYEVVDADSGRVWPVPVAAPVAELQLR